MKLLQKGNKERTQEPTAANKTSSRSHALLMVNVKQTAKSRSFTKSAVKFGRLYMIDLAGSERASQTEVNFRFDWFEKKFETFLSKKHLDHSFSQQIYFFSFK